MVLSDKELNALAEKTQKARSEKRRNELFSELWPHIEKRLLGVSRKIARRYRIDADEAFSMACEVILTAAIPSYKRYADTGKEHSFEAFMILVVRRRLITYAKRWHGVHREPENGPPVSIDAPRTESGIADELGLAAILADDLECDPAHVVTHRKELSHLWGRLKRKLSTYELQVVQLYCAGITYEEIAERLGPEKHDWKSIDNALGRIRRKAQKLYERYKKRTGEEKELGR